MDTYDASMQRLVTAVPIGFSDSKACRVQIKLRGNIFSPQDFCEAKVLHHTPIISTDDEIIGEITA